MGRLDDGDGRDSARQRNRVDSGSFVTPSRSCQSALAVFARATILEVVSLEVAFRCLFHELPPLLDG